MRCSWIRFWLLMIPALFSILALPAARAEDVRVGEIPFVMEDDHIHVVATVNGAMALRLILDTGLGSPGIILLAPETGERLDLQYVTEIQLGGGGGDRASRPAKVAVGATVSLSGVNLREQQVLVIQDEGVLGNLYADGIIGASLFQYVVEVDYDREVLRLYDDLTEEPSHYGHSFKLGFTFGIPVVDASLTVDGTEWMSAELIVDTGVNDPLLLFAHSADVLSPPERVIEGRNRILSEGFTGEMLGSTGRIAHLHMGPFSFGEVVASFPEKESMGPALQLGRNGMLGNEILRRFTVVFDYGGERMFLRPGETYGEPFEYNMAGLVMVREKESFRIEDVIRNSPAEEQGLRAGDHLIEINGRGIAEYEGPEIGRIFSAQGESVEVTVERESETFHRRLACRRLI